MNLDDLIKELDLQIKFASDNGYDRLEDAITAAKEQILRDQPAVQYCRDIAHRGDYLGNKALEAIIGTRIREGEIMKNPGEQLLDDVLSYMEAKAKGHLPDINHSPEKYLTALAVLSRYMPAIKEKQNAD